MSTAKEHQITLDLPDGLYTHLAALATRDATTVEALTVGLLAEVITHGPPAALAAEVALLSDEVKALELAMLRLSGGAA